MFGQKRLYSGKVFVFGQNWLKSGKSCSIHAKVVVFGQKWLYSGKVFLIIIIIFFEDINFTDK